MAKAGTPKRKRAKPKLSDKEQSEWSQRIWGCSPDERSDIRGYYICKHPRISLALMRATILDEPSKP